MYPTNPSSVAPSVEHSVDRHLTVQLIVRYAPFTAQRNDHLIRRRFVLRVARR